VDRTVDAATALQRGVGRVDDRVDGEHDDVGVNGARGLSSIVASGHGAVGCVTGHALPRQLRQGFDDPFQIAVRGAFLGNGANRLAVRCRFVPISASAWA